MDEWEAGRHTEAEPSHDGHHSQEFEAVPELEHREVRESPARMVWQIILAVVGIAAFVTLVFVWRDGAGRIDDVTALLILTGVLFVILLLEILLLRPIFDALFRRVPASLPLTPEEDNFIVGCPGCGTVFTITQDELDVGNFGCHNCGRAGYIKDYQLNRSAINEEVCRSCGNKYLEYMEFSECPICHTYNEY